MNQELQYSLLMVLSTFIASCSQILLKKSAEKQYDSKIKEYLNPYVLLGYGLFFACSLLSVLALRHVPLSKGPVLESTSYIFITLLSYIFLKEKVTKGKFLGMACILLGIYICSL